MFAIVRVVGWDIEYLGRDGSWCPHVGFARQYQDRGRADEIAQYIGEGAKSLALSFVAHSAR